MDNLLRAGIFIITVLLSSPLTAQPTSSGLRSELAYSLTDSLGPEKSIAAQTRPNRLKASPLSLLLGQLSLFYERPFARQTSFVVGYGTGGNTANFGSQLQPGGVTYQRVTIEVRRYWEVNRLTGFYLGPYLRASRLTVSEFLYDQQGNVLKDSQGVRLTTSERAIVWIPGLIVGGQWIRKWFCLDSFLGIQRQVVVGSPARGNQLVEAMTAAWMPRFGLTVGVAF